MANLKLSERACFTSPPFIVTADGTVKTGITVTANIYRLNTDGSLTTVATGSATTEVGTTGVFYLTSTATSTAGTYWAVFVTGDTTVAAREMTSERIIIGLGGHENLDAASSTLATASALSTVAGYVDTEVAAIKAKTDLIPAAPAAVGDIPTTAQIVAAVVNDRVTGTTSGTPTTTSIATTGSDLSSTDDVYNGAFLVATSGVLKGVARKITDYTGSTKTFTTQAFPSALAASVTVAVVGNVPS